MHCWAWNLCVWYLKYCVGWLVFNRWPVRWGIGQYSSVTGEPCWRLSGVEHEYLYLYSSGRPISRHSWFRRSSDGKWSLAINCLLVCLDFKEFVVRKVWQVGCAYTLHEHKNYIITSFGLLCTRCCQRWPWCVQHPQDDQLSALWENYFSTWLTWLCWKRE